MLAALHPPYSLVIWDTRNKTKLWKKTYTETLVSFKFDPFAPSKLACEFVSINFSQTGMSSSLFIMIFCLVWFKNGEHYISDGLHNCSIT